MRKLTVFGLLVVAFSSGIAQVPDLDNVLREKDKSHSAATSNLLDFSTVDNPHLTGDEIQDLATRNAYEMATLMSSQVQWDGGTDLYIRNAAAAVYVDGVKLRGSISLPKKAIGEVRIISGGGGQ